MRPMLSGRDFGYNRRAEAVEAARAEIHAAFAEVRNRNDLADPRTQRWDQAIQAFNRALDRVYSEPLRQIAIGNKSASETDTASMLDFLEADPVFFRSGYMKEELLTELKRRNLDQREMRRLQDIILTTVQRDHQRREFRRYCLVAANVVDEAFMADLLELERSTDANVSRRAAWVLAALRRVR